MVAQHILDTWKSETYEGHGVGVPGVTLMATGALPPHVEQAEVPNPPSIVQGGSMAGPSEPRTSPGEEGEMSRTRDASRAEADRMKRGYVLMTEKQLQGLTSNFMKKWEEGKAKGKFPG